MNTKEKVTRKNKMKEKKRKKKNRIDPQLKMPEDLKAPKKK